jgi:hypothetical protein
VTDSYASQRHSLFLGDHPRLTPRQSGSRGVPDTAYELHQLLGSATWCGHFLADQLGHQIGVDRGTVLKALRQELAERFHNKPEEDQQ